MLAYFMRFLMPRSSVTTCIYICKLKKMLYTKYDTFTEAHLGPIKK